VFAAMLVSTILYWLPVVLKIEIPVVLEAAAPVFMPLQYIVILLM
jgi:hypothetical protein